MCVWLRARGAFPGAQSLCPGGPLCLLVSRLCPHVDRCTHRHTIVHAWTHACTRANTHTLFLRHAGAHIFTSPRVLLIVRLRLTLRTALPPQDSLPATETGPLQESSLLLGTIPRCPPAPRSGTAAALRGSSRACAVRGPRRVCRCWVHPRWGGARTPHALHRRWGLRLSGRLSSWKQGSNTLPREEQAHARRGVLHTDQGRN